MYCKRRWGGGEGEPQSTRLGMLGMGRLTAARPIWHWFILNFSYSAVSAVSGDESVRLGQLGCVANISMEVDGVTRTFSDSSTIDAFN